MQRTPFPRALLGLECAAFFGVLPGVLAWSRARGGSFPVLGTLAVAALAAWIALLRARGYDRRELVRWRLRPGELGRILVHIVVGGALLAAWVLVFEPERWLAFPRGNPRMWAIVMVFYPLVSVYPQELLFRAFFLHRYEPLWGAGRGAALASAAAFGWVHVVFLSPFAVLLSTLGGLLFARTYLRSRSLPLVSIEHAVYGCLIFTVGLGRHFYAGS